MCSWLFHPLWHCWLLKLPSAQWSPSERAHTSTLHITNYPSQNAFAEDVWCNIMQCLDIRHEFRDVRDLCILESGHHNKMKQSQHVPNRSNQWTDAFLANGIGTGRNAGSHYSKGLAYCGCSLHRGASKKGLVSWNMTPFRVLHLQRSSSFMYLHAVLEIGSTPGFKNSRCQL